MALRRPGGNEEDLLLQMPEHQELLVKDMLVVLADHLEQNPVEAVVPC